MRTREVSDFLKVRQLIGEQKSIPDSLAVLVLVVEGFKHDWGEGLFPYVAKGSRLLH